MAKEDEYVDLARDGERIEKLAARLRAGIPDETSEHARFVAKEMVGAIHEIHAAHRKCLSEDGCHVKKGWFSREIDTIVSKIAQRRGGKEEKMYGPLIHALNRQQTGAIRELVKGEKGEDGKEPVVECVPLPEGWVPENDAEKDLARGALEALADSIPVCQTGAACEGVLQGEGTQNERLSEEDRNLVQSALDSDRLSAEETALKQRVAVDNYIAMRNDKEFAGSPLAGAIQTAVTSVEQTKRLYAVQKIWQTAFDEAERREKPENQCELAAQAAVEKQAGKWEGYCKAGFVATVVTLLRRGLLGDATEWLGRNVLSIPVNVVTSPVAEILRWFGIDLYAFNRQACGWIARHAIRKPLAKMAEKVFPVVKAAAVVAAKVTVETAKKAAQIGARGARQVARVVCQGIQATGNAIKAVAVAVANGARKAVAVGKKALDAVGGALVAGASKAADLARKTFDVLRDYGPKIFTRWF